MVYTRYEMRTSSECQNISRQVNFTIALVSPFRIEIRKFTSLNIYKAFYNFPFLLSVDWIISISHFSRSPKLRNLWKLFLLMFYIFFFIKINDFCCRIVQLCFVKYHKSLTRFSIFLSLTSLEKGNTTGKIQINI